MKKPKIDSKYSNLIEVSNITGSRYENLVYLDAGTKSLISTNGRLLLAERGAYTETEVIARLLGAENRALKFNGENLEKNEEYYGDIPDFASIIPPIAEIDSGTTKRIRLELPSWLNAISKRLKVYPELHFILGEDAPTIAFKSGPEDNSIVLNGRFLVPFAGQIVDLYFIADKAFVLILPEGQKLDSSPWFSLLMEIRPEKIAPTYF